MFSPENALRPLKKSRSNAIGSDVAEAPLFTGIDFPDTLDGHVEGLGFGLEDNDFADCMLPILFDGSPDNALKLNSSPGDAALRPAAAPRAPPALPAPIPSSASLPVPGRFGGTGAGQQHIPAPAPALAPAPLSRSASLHCPPAQSPPAAAGAFIPTPAAAASEPAACTTVSSSAQAPQPHSSAGGGAPGHAASRLGTGSGPFGSPGAGGRVRAAGKAPAKQRSGSGSGSWSGSGSVLAGLKSGSASLGGGLPASPRQGLAPAAAPKGRTVLTAAAAPVRSAKGGGSGGSFIFSGQDGDDVDNGGGDDSIEDLVLAARGSPALLRRTGSAALLAGPAAAAYSGGGAAAAAGGGCGSLLSRAFNGAMRPEVAALAAVAAQRALVTSPSIRPGLYFSEPEQSQSQVQGADQQAGRGGGGAVGKGAGAGVKRGGKDRQGPGAAAAGPSALPFAKYYPEADAELMAALYGKRPLPRRVRVVLVTDRCHPCFRNPFEGLAGVKERRKLVAAGPLPEGALLGAYTGELRSGKMDERLVGGDLSGSEGLKAAFTLTLLDDLETRASEQEVVAPNAAPARDSLVVVGDPATCPLAEANAPRFWGSCSSLKPGSAGEGNRAACNCRTYTGRANNAAVIPCVFKVRLSRLRAHMEAAVGGSGSGGGVGDAAQGLEVLRAAAAAVTTSLTLPASQSGGTGVTSAVAAAPMAATSATAGARVAIGGGGAAATAMTSADDVYVYGIVTVVVTSAALKEGEEVLLRWDSDDSFFAVADQNLRQYLYIRGLTAERDAAEAKAAEHGRQLALLRTAHRECQAAREAATQRRDEAVQHKEAAERALEEAVRQRDEAVRQRDEAAEDVRSQHTGSAAVAATGRLEALATQLREERDALAAQLEQLFQQRQQQRACHAGSPPLAPPAGPGPAVTAVRPALLHDDEPPPPDHLQPQTWPLLDSGAEPQNQTTNANTGATASATTASGRPPHPQRQPRDSSTAVPLLSGGGDDDSDDDDAAAAEILRRYAEAKQRHDAAAAEVAAALQQRRAAQRRRAQMLEGELAEARRELEASRLRAAQLEQRLMRAAGSGGDGGGW